MRLDKLEINGFKSFRDKTSLEFPGNFTTIVGPNGSGKSNIIDSICFVLGKSRGLRVNSMAELICNGGINGKHSDYARVSMYLKGDNGSRAKLTREITGDGRSIYKLDDKRTTRQEMIELVGDSEYNILLQDDVTKLIDMHPKQRREIIDDLCGIRGYDEKKRKALKELGDVENRISDTRILLGEREGYLEQLKSERDEAIHYQELRSELESLKANICYNNMCRFERKIESLGEAVDGLTKEQGSKRGELDKLRTEILGMNNRLKEMNAEILGIEKERGGSELRGMREDMIRLENQLQNSGKDLGNLVDGRDKALEKKKTLEGEIGDIDSRVGGLKEEINKLGAYIGEEARKVGDPEIGGRIDELKGRILQQHSSVALNVDRNEEGLKELERLGGERVNLDAEIKELLAREKELARAVDDKLMENKSNFEQYEELRAKIPSLLRERESTLTKLNQLRVKLAEKKTRIDMLESSSGGLRGAIAAIMKLRGVIEGIHGTVSQLGNVTDGGYETALQISAGNGMQYIVVDGEDAATKCIEYLRSKRIGRSTFLPLSKLSLKLRDKAPAGSIGFARDFIETDKKYRPAFDYIFRDTILVEDLKTAKKIGIGKWRMVTLDGDLILPSGAMTGGYLKKNKLATMSFSNTEDIANEVKVLSRRIIELDGEQQKLEIERNKLERKLSELEQPVKTGVSCVEKIKLEKNNLSDKRSGLKERVRWVDARVQEVKRDISGRDKEIKSLDRDVKALEKNLGRLMKKRSGGGIEKLESLRDRHRNLEIEKGRMDEKRSFLFKQLDECNSSLQDMGKRISSVTLSIAGYKTDHDLLKAELEGMERANSALINELEALISKRSDIEDAVSSSSNMVGEVEYLLEGVNDKLNKASVNKARVEAKHSDLRQEFEGYRDFERVEMGGGAMDVRVREIEAGLESLESVNLKAIESYDILKSEIEETSEKIETLRRERESIFEFMEGVERRKKGVFMEAFNVVKKNFEEIYHEFSGGAGALMLDNPRDISESGLIINASPKGKKLVNIDAMSGGEKVVTCSAFMLAIQRYNPSHFYIVDELDAALDADNSIQLAKMLKNSNAQFVMITHNESVIKHAESVIGVTMNNGISDIVGVRLN